MSEVQHDFFRNAMTTYASLSDKVGNTEKQRKIEIDAVVFFQIMQQLNGTFVWEDGPRKGHKFSTVFEALAATMPAFEDLGLLERSVHVQEFAPRLRSGFYAARKWLAEWFMSTVFAVPQHNESSLLSVITLDPYFVLACGKTASQMQSERDLKLARGQLKASVIRLAASNKKDDIAVMLDEIMKQVKVALLDMRPSRNEQQIN